MKPGLFTLILVVCFTMLSRGNQQSEIEDYSKEELRDSTNFEGWIYQILTLAKTYPDSALQIALKNEEKALSIDRPFWTGKYHFLLGSVKIYTGDYEFALVELELALDILKSCDRPEELGHCYNNIGLVYTYLGDLVASISNYLKALKVAEEAKSSEWCSRLLMNIGIVHRKMGDLEEARKYYQKAAAALKIWANSDPNADSQTLSAQLQLNVANVFLDMEFVDSALISYKDALAIFEDIDNDVGQSIALLNISSIYYIRSDNDNCLKYALKSLSIAIKRNDSLGLAAGYETLGYFYDQVGKVDSGIYYCLQSELISKKLGVLDKEIEACDCLYKLNMTKRDYEQAVKYLEKAVLLKEQMINEANIKEITKREVSFEFKQQALIDSLRHQEENKLNRLKIEQKIKKNKYLLVFLVVAGIFVGIVFWRYRITRSQKKIIERQEIMLKKDFDHLKEFTENASHEIQTPMAIIQSKLDVLLQSSDLTEEHVRHIADVSNASQRLSTLNRSLLLISKIENNQFSEIREVNFSALLEKQIAGLTEIYEYKNIEVTKSIAPETKILGNQYLCDVVISNLLKNSIAHNIPNGKVIIELTRDEFKVENTGKALSVEPEKLFVRFKKESTGPDSTGLGLSIVKKACDFSSWSIDYTCIKQVHTVKVGFR